MDRLSAGILVFFILAAAALGLDYLESWWASYINRQLKEPS